MINLLLEDAGLFFYSFGFKGNGEQNKRRLLGGFYSRKERKKVFAYLTDLNGGFHFYHDANDSSNSSCASLEFLQLRG
jgi:hypothetical protein